MRGCCRRHIHSLRYSDGFRFPYWSGGLVIQTLEMVLKEFPGVNLFLGFAWLGQGLLDVAGGVC